MSDLLLGPCIVTRYLGPTNYKGSRVIATHKRACDAKWTKTLSWDHALSAEENHQAAAQALLNAWPYTTTLRIVGRGHDAEAYFWLCCVEEA